MYMYIYPFHCLISLAFSHIDSITVNLWLTRKYGGKGYQGTKKTAILIYPEKKQIKSLGNWISKNMSHNYQQPAGHTLLLD